MSEIRSLEVDTVSMAKEILRVVKNCGTTSSQRLQLPRTTDSQLEISAHATLGTIKKNEETKKMQSLLSLLNQAL